MNNKDANFSIKSTHESFAAKQKNLFDLLDSAEKKTKRSLSPEAPMETDNATQNNPKRITKHYKSKESIFKRPEAPIQKCLPLSRLPNFRKNPNKWTKYSLKDVTDEDMSERGNTKAALSFLKDLEQRKLGESDEKIDVLPEKIAFKRTAVIKEVADEEGKVTFKSSKVVMPEYVVGQKVRKDRTNKRVREAESSNRQLKLDHLFDEDEEQ